MLKKIAVFKYAMLFGALLTFGLFLSPQAEARTNKAICKTVKGPVYISRSLTKSRFLAYSKCARYRKNGWQFLRRKVSCVKRYRKGKRIYRCRCIARLCKPRKAAGAKKDTAASQKAAPVPVKKPVAAEEKKAPVSTKKSDQEEMKKETAPKAEMKKEADKAEPEKQSEEKPESKPAPEKKEAEKKPEAAKEEKAE